MANSVIFFSACGPHKMSAQEQQIADAEKQDSLNKKAEADSISNLQKELVNDSIDNTHIKGYNVKLVTKGDQVVNRMEVEYKSLAELLEQNSADAKSKMWTAYEAQSKRDLYIERYRGGEVVVSIYDQNINAANIKNLTVIVKDTTDKEICRQEFDDKTADVVGNEFSGYAIANIEVKVPSHFFVYVVHSFGKTPNKYEVTPITK